MGDKGTDINEDFKKQLLRMRSGSPAATVTPDRKMSPAPVDIGHEFNKQLNQLRAPEDNTAIYLSHAKPGPYKTELDGSQESQFQQWVKENEIPWQDTENADYDMRGYWKALVSGDKRARQAANKHYPDIWKTPYHKSFSRDSMYALPTAPKWEGDKLVGSNGQILMDESAKPADAGDGGQPAALGYIQKYAPIYGVDPKLIQAMMGRESGGRQSAVSPKGALGVMQLMPATARDLGVDPNDEEDNVRGGIKYMSELLAHFGGDPRLALAAYHAGQGAVDKAGGIPNTSDGLSKTSDYVDQIMRRYEKMSPDVPAETTRGMSPTPEEIHKSQPKPAPKSAPEMGTYRYTTMGGATMDRQYDRSEFKDELASIRSLGEEKYIAQKGLKFSPEPGIGPEQGAEDYSPFMHPFKFIGFINEAWGNIGTDIDEGLFDESKRNEEFRSFLKQQSENEQLPPQEREEYKTGLRAFDVSVMQGQKHAGEGMEAGLPVARSLVHDLFDWYNPMMMALRGFHVVGEGASLLTGKAGMLARRAFYAANAAVGGKFTYDQTQSAMDKFRQGDNAGGWAELGGAGAMGFMTALGLAAARPKAHPVEVREETIKRLDALHKTLREQPEFRRMEEMMKQGKASAPFSLPNMTPEDVDRVLGDLRRRAGNRPNKGLAGPAAAEQQPSDLPFTDKRGTEKEESSQPHIIDAPVLSAQEREFRRQELREQETMDLILRERNERERRAVGNAQKYRDQVVQQLERERALASKDKRRVAPAELVDLRERMETMAQSEMYIDSADMARSLLEKKPRGKPLTSKEKDFLRLWEERKRMTRRISGVEDAQMTKFGREEAQKEGELVETEQRLVEASRKLSEKARTASTPDESEELAGQSDEALKRAEQIRTDVDQARAARDAAKQQQQEYPLAAPINKIAGGATTQVRLPDGRKLAARYTVTTADQLIASHHPESFEWNEKYLPRKMQPRDYSINRDARAGVIAGGNEFEHDSFHNTDNTGHNGPPIVLSDGRVAGGNGRLMRFLRAHKTEQRDAIHADLVKKAAQFGLNPGEIPAAEKIPVLVRVLDESPTDLQTLIELGQDLNRDEMRGFSAAEQAVMSGERLSQDTLEWVGRRLDDMGDDASIRELMRTQGLALFQKLVADGVISPTKRAEFVTNDGEMTTRAKDMFENAMLGKVISDADLIATMPKQIRDKIFRALAPLAKIRAAEPAWDFTDYLQEAVRHWKRIDAISDTLDVYGTSKSRSEQYMEFQGSKMIKEPIHPAVEALVRLLDEKPLKIKDSFYKYIDDYEGRQQSLMGIEPPTPRMAFNKNVGEKVGVEVGENEWGTILPVEEPPAPKQQAAAEDEEEQDVEYGELADVPTDQLEADIEAVREITNNDESDPMLRAYLRELRTRTDRGKQTQPAVAVEPPPTRQEVEKDAAQESLSAINQDVDLAVELSTAGPMTEEKLLDILSRHPRYSAGKASAAVTVIKSFVQNYLKEGFDDWLKRSIAQVNVTGKGPDGDALFQKRRMDPLPGFEHTFDERKDAKAAYEGEQLSWELLEKKGDISKKSGDMERHSPLFSGTAANPERSLFDPTPDEKADPTRMLESTPEEKKEAPIAKFRKEAEKIKGRMPPVDDGFVRLWRGNRPGEEGVATRFTDDLPGIALPFNEGYGGRLTYVDVPAADLDKYRQANGEFNLPADLATQAEKVPREVNDKAAYEHMSGGALADTDYMGRAKAELGPSASPSEVLLLAQKLKEKQDSRKPSWGMLFQHGETMASVEELARGEVFYRVNRGGQLTYQGVSPDANLREGEALIGVKRDGSMRIQNSNMGMPDAKVIERVRPRVLNAVSELARASRYQQANKGAVEFLADGKAVIHLLQNADLSTILHEFAHVARRQLKPEDSAVVKEWLHIKGDTWEVIHEEKFARAFEKYLYDGEAPTPELKSVFKRIRDWMVDVYQQVKGTSINIKFPDEVRQVFDRMVAGDTLSERSAPEAKPKTSEVEKLQKKLRAPVSVDEIEKMYTPGKIVPSYGGSWDRVIRFDRGQGPSGWTVTVVHTDKDGAALLGERERTHSTPPSVKEVVDAGIRDDIQSQIAMAKVAAKQPDKSLPAKLDSEARKIQAVQESKGEMVTPEERMGATKIAEGGEALSDAMADARMRVFPDQEQAIQWAKENKDRLRGIQLFTLQDGRGFAHYLPKDARVLFQEVDPAELERRLRLIDERMSKIIPEAERTRLGKMRQELAAQKARQDRQMSATPNQAAGKVIKLWTPEGEKEISDGPRKSDSERGTLDPPPELQEPRRTDRVPEQAGRPGSAEQDRPARGARGSTKGGGGKPDGGKPRKALPDVVSAKLDAPVHDRGTELYTKEQWAERAKLLRLPANSPPPTVRIPASLRRMLIFPGQPEVVELALSGLKQHDGFVMATTTGTGKTYTGSAILNQMHKPGMKTLVLTTSQDLIHQRGNGWMAVARDFDVDLNELPPGVGFPDEPGAYITTYATAIGREGIADQKWDFIVADEIGEARKWYSSQRGAMMKTMSANSGKILWMSATPFHTALEIGHMDKLGLWREQGWPAWSAQFGVYRDAEGNWAGGNAPKKLLKLREQLVERGQFVNVDRNMEGFETSFAQVPLTPRQVEDVKNIGKAFALAEDYFIRRKRKSMIRAVKGNAVTYVKKYLERARLPQAIEMGRKLEEQGWKVIFFSETKTERDEIFDFLKEADEDMGGQLSQLLPPLPSVPDELSNIFLDDIANYSGPHSAFRSSEKDAFNDDSKKHIYVSYAAGGIGVSLHDTSGTRPRAVIYLGPPYSGVMFDQAIGRAWRYGTKSNVHAIFMTSNARPEIRLILEKVAPRMSSLRALVSGIDNEDKFVNTLRSMDSTREGQIAYELGNKVKVDASDFLETETTHAVQSWKDVGIHSANEAKNKGMKFPVEPEGGPAVIKLFQREEDEYEPPEPPEDLQMPGESRASVENQSRRTQWEEGMGVPLPGPNRTTMADDISAQAGEDARQGDGDPLAAIGLRWENTKKYVTTVWDAVEGSRPVKAAKVQDMYWMTNGRKVIRDVAADAGSPNVGIKIARMLPEYHVEWGNISGPWVQRYFEILRENNISTKNKVSYRDPKTGEMKEVNEHHNLVMAKQGKQPPANARIAHAVEQTTELMSQVRARLAKENVAVEVYDDGHKRMVPFDQIMDDPNYWPRKYDPNYEIKTTDPETGQVETVKLKELVGGELGDAKRERIISYMMREHGLRRVDAEDWLEGRNRDVPLVGNVERAREYDLPFYRTDPGAMISYLEGAGEAAARTRIFGQKREKLEREIGKVGNVKARARIREIMDSVLSKRSFEEETKAFVSLAADWSVLTKMGFSALKAVGHSVHAALSSNTRAYLRGLLDGVGNWKEAHERAVFSGAILEQYKTEMLREYGAKRKVSSKFLDLVGFQGTYEFGRVVADATARQFLNKYALPKIKAERGVEYYRRMLKDVYLLDDATIDHAVEVGRWSEDDLNRAGKALSDKTMFTYDPSELPPAWRARSAEGIADNVLAGVRVVTLLKGYMFKTSALIRERVFDEVKKGNFRPLIPFVLLYPAMGELIADLSALFTANRKRYDDLFNSKESIESRLMYRFVSDMAHATGLTLVDTLLESAFRQHSATYASRDVTEFAAGPFLSDALHTFVQLPLELIAAQSGNPKRRGTTAGEKRYNSLVRWLRSTFPAVTPIINLTKEDKKKGSGGSAEYHFSPMPTR